MVIRSPHKVGSEPSEDSVHSKSPRCAQPCPSALHCAPAAGSSLAELVTVHVGLQCLQTSSPAWWTWPSWRMAQHPWSAWHRGCLLPVSQSFPSALAHSSLGLFLGPLDERGISIAPYSLALHFPPDIAWYKGQDPLSARPGWTLSQDGKHLEIQRAQLSDTGSYRCVASNVAGVTELWYSLQVTGESVVSGGRTAAA